MNMTFKFDTDGIDWTEIATIYDKSSFDPRSPEELQADFDAAAAVCFAYDIDRFIGLARLVKTDDGHTLHDLCILSGYQGLNVDGEIHYWITRKIDGEIKFIAKSDAEREKCVEFGLTEFLA